MTIEAVRWERYPRLYRAGKFGAVGIAGLAVNLLAQALLIEAFGLEYLAAAVVATQISSTFNFLVADVWVFDAPEAVGGRARRYGSFLAMNNVALVLRAPIMFALVDGVGMHYAFANFVSLMVLTIVRFGVADTMIWRTADVTPRRAPSAVTRRPVLPRVAADSSPVAELSARAQSMTLASIVATGAFVRVWQLTAVGYNSDEAVYASQAAGIAGDASLAEYFPVFRAHPMLFQAMLSIPYRASTSDAVGRLSSVAFGLATVVLVFAVARHLYDARVGLVAAGVVAVMPYHVIVTRQVLLDGPMTFFATLTLYCMVRFVRGLHLRWLLAAAAALGATTLTKETYVVLVGSVFMFFALSPEIRLRIRDAAAACAVFFVVLLPFPITVVSAGKSDTGKSYLSWQLFRRSNHGYGFYAHTLPPYVGYAVLLGAAAAIAVTWGTRRTWRERLLLSFIVVPVAFFEVWPVKGFHYLLAASIPLAILAAHGLLHVHDALASWCSRRVPVPRAGPLRAASAVPSLVLAVAAMSLLVPTWSAVQASTSDSLLAGTGGVPGGRELGSWVGEHVPEGAEFMTVGPSMANLVQYYGHRRAYGLSVSPNPLNRNPSYEPIVNPDLAIRLNDLQYLVWDSYSTSRSPFFGERLLTYAERYHGREVYRYESAGRPVIIVYEVRP